MQFGAYFTDWAKSGSFATCAASSASKSAYYLSQIVMHYQLITHKSLVSVCVGCGER